MKNLLIVLLLAFCSCKPAEEEDNIRFDCLFSLIFILIFTVMDIGVALYCQVWVGV